jgi:hypothetical protein
VKAAIAHARKPPKSSTSARLPLESRCAKAQSFTLRSCGWCSRALMAFAGT